MPKHFVFTFLLIIISLATTLAISFSGQGELERDLRAQHLKAGDFELQNEGKIFKLSQMQGSPIVLYFGYTFCPDVCPVGLARIRDVLISNDAFKNIPVLFITLDPERDTSERLNEYTRFFHPNIMGLRGSVDEVKSISAAYGTFLRSNKEEGENDAEYTIDHSAYFYLIDSNGLLMRVLDHDTKVSEISELLHKLL